MLKPDAEQQMCMYETQITTNSSIITRNCLAIETIRVRVRVLGARTMKIRPPTPNNWANNNRWLDYIALAYIVGQPIVGGPFAMVGRSHWPQHARTINLFTLLTVSCTAYIQISSIIGLLLLTLNQQNRPSWMLDLIQSLGSLNL